MKTTGTLKDIFRDFATGKLVVSFLVDTTSPDDELTGGYTLDIVARRHRERRSLNANSYFHVLCEKLAAKLGTTNTAMKNKMISEYGCTDIELGKIILEDSVDWMEIESLHLRPTAAVRTLNDGKLYRVYYVMRGSHTYNTAEMARLIDGAVQEAKEQGIETMTPEQIERMKALWKSSGERKDRA